MKESLPSNSLRHGVNVSKWFLPTVSMYQSVRVYCHTNYASYSPRHVASLYKRVPFPPNSLRHGVNGSKWFLPTVSMYQSVRVLPPSSTQTTSKAGYSPRPCCFSLYQRTPLLHLPGTSFKFVKVVLTYCINVPVSESTASKLHTNHHQGRVFSKTMLFLDVGLYSYYETNGNRILHECLCIIVSIKLASKTIIY